MKIVFLTNAHTSTAVSYIESLLNSNIEISGVVLLSPLNIKRIIAKIKKYGLGHIFKRVLDVVKIKRKTEKCCDQISVERLIKKSSLKSFKVNNINSKKTIKIIESLNPDIIFVCTLSQILKNDIIKIPKYECINIHAGLLPKYRGPASNFWVLYNNEEITGVSFHDLEVGIDNGDMLLQKELKIEPNDTEETLDIKLSKLGSEYIAELVSDIEKQRMHRIPQNESEATYYSQPSVKQRKELKNKRNKC